MLAEAVQPAETVTIVLAESDESVAKSLTAALSHQGWQVVQARDAVGATAAVLRRRPQAVFVRGDVPGGGGTVIIRRLRASVHTTMIPVLAASGEEHGTEDELRAAGADEVLAHVVDPQRVVSWIGEQLGVPVEVLEAPAEIIGDADRLASLRETGLLDSSPSKVFDSLTGLAAAALGVPVALVSLVDEDRQFFKSHIGLPEPWASARETPLTHSFCQWVVSDHEPLVVTDARQHGVLRDNLALRDLGVLAYAGVPLTALSGDPIGSFCAIDDRPRVWSEEDLELLKDLTRAADACVGIAEWESRAEVAGETDPSVPIFRSLAIQAIGEGIEAISSILSRGPALSSAALAPTLDLLRYFGQQILRLSDS